MLVVCVLRALLCVHEMVGELGGGVVEGISSSDPGAMCAGDRRETRWRLQAVCGRAEELCAGTRPGAMVWRHASCVCMGG